MSPLKSDEYIRRAAQELHVDQSRLRDLLNTADSNELLQRAARMVVDDSKELGAVARAFGVNEEYLGKAVWYMKENRQREADERLQPAAAEVVDRNKEVGAVARIFGVNEEHLAEAVWLMKQNRQREAQRKQREWEQYPGS